MAARDKSTKHRLQVWELTVLCAVCGSIQTLWAIQNGNASPFFLQLGVAAKHLPVVWLAGPISGLVVQPLVGSWSDRLRTSCGRRRPVLALFSVLTAASAISLAWSRSIATELQLRASTVAISAFWCLDMVTAIALPILVTTAV